MDLFEYAKLRVSPPPGVPEDVAAMFESLALELYKKGWRRYSSDAILHRIRWHMHVERGNREFKCNDHWTSVLSRWFLLRHPILQTSYKGKPFFELREIREEAA